MKRVRNISIIVGIIMVIAFACKHEPLPAPIHINDTVWLKKHHYIFKDTLGAGGGTHHVPIYGSSGDTIKDSICFSEEILPIVVSHCAKPGCHDAITAAEGLTYTNYASIRSAVRPGNPSAGDFMGLINDGSMPPTYSPPALTAAEIKLLQDWINQGAKNNIDCGMGCDTTKFAFAANVTPLIASYCTGCHNSSSAGGGYDFGSYSGVVKAITAGRLMGAIYQNTGYSAMPKGGGKLSDCEIKIIQKWVNAGYPNN